MTAKQLTIILGAGASHDCGDENTASRLKNKFRPPLAKDIFSGRFDGILNRFPAITARLDELRTQLSKNGNFEEVFRTLLESATRHQTFWPFQLPLYLRELFWTISEEYIQGSSKFDTLVRRTLESSFEQVLFVNLNYDLFLEDALTNYHQHQFLDLTSYMPSSKNWRYLKPHGSVNWARIMVNCPSDSSGWFFPSRLQDPPVCSPDLRIVMWNRHSGDFYIPGGGPRGYLYPQVVVPTDKPKSFVAPDEHVAEARRFIDTCRHFLAIGFSGRDEDVLRLFEAVPSESRWTIVSQGDARASVRRISSTVAALKPKNGTLACYDKGFSKFVGDKVFEDFCKAEDE